ncbi:zf-HC2 domain-containing protein [Streptomyces sparsogenes]|uniref:zf-HC2 domain-containing protein n=1 Tax=Streptomyces sparsogenes TaxID=67365 RepID=UPI0038517E4D
MKRPRPARRGGSAAWHVTQPQAASYADGSLPETDAWSVEKHVEACAPCAARVSAAVRAGTAAPALADVRAALLAFAEADAHTAATAPAGAPGAGAEAPAPRPAPAVPGLPAAPADTAAARRAPASRLAGDLSPDPTAHADTPAARHSGQTPAPAADGRTAVAARHAGPEPGGVGGARARRRGAFRGPRAWVGWAAGPAVRGPWLVALLVTGLVAAGAARAAGLTGVRPLLLALAPVLPSAGVAVSYGRHADPMHELAASTPSGGLRLLLTRTASVLAVSVPLLTLAGQLLPAAAGAPAAPAWLLPGLALTLAALALASYVGCRIATCAVAAGWLLAVGGPALLADPADGERLSLSDAVSDALATVLSGPAAQSCWAAAAAVCAGLLALRRTSFDHLERI